jgi:hypothetical protein
MPEIFIPPKVAAEIQAESRLHQKEVMDSLETQSKIEYWDRVLREIDPNLHLLKAKDWVRTGVSLRPCYWHLIRDNSDKGAPPTVMILEGENGEYIEPNSGMLDKLKRNDMQRPGFMRELREQEEKIRIAQEKEREKEREERQQEMYERWLAGTRVGVSMNRSTPWTQNARGRRK